MQTYSKRSAFVDFVCFQVVWLACAIGASVGLWWPGVLAGLSVVGLQLVLRSRRYRILVLALGTSLLGFVLETVLIHFGWLTYRVAWPSEVFAPIWIVALWAAFATVLDALRYIFGARPILKGALVGIGLGPLSYVAASKVGALDLSDPVWSTLLVLGVLWGLSLPVLIWLAGANSFATDPN